MLFCVDARLAAETARADGVFRPSDAQMRDWRVVLQPYSYSPWQIEAYRDGIVLFARTEDRKGQISLTCSRNGGGDLIVVRKEMTKQHVDSIADVYGSMLSFSIFGRTVPKGSTRFSRTDDALTLRIPLQKVDLDAMQGPNRPQSGLEPGPEEPHMNAGVFREIFPMEGLARHVKLLRRNCSP